MQVFALNAKVYDLSTAMFFAFALGFLAREKFQAFYVIYPIGCLNRETMFLLSVFFAFHFFRRFTIVNWLMGLGYQGTVFMGIRVMLMKIFEKNPGTAFTFRPLQLLGDYWHYAAWTLAMLGLVALIGWFVVREWKQKPAFLRSALVVLFPLGLGLHLCLGWAFEIRVFAEIFPVVIALGAWGFGIRLE